jgi:hypothetical protein
MAGLTFLTLRDFTPPAGAKVYRHRTRTAALWLAVMWGVALVMLYIAWRGGIRFNNRGDGIPPFIGWIVGSVLGLVGWWIWSIQLKARLKPTNWLAMLARDGIHVKYRSILNAHFPVDDEQIVFLPFGAIRAARQHRRKWETPSSKGGTQLHSATFIELRLDAADATLLAEKLAAERRTKGPRRKTWYGSTRGARWGDYPVQVIDGNAAITWTVHPDAAQFLADLGSRVTVGSMEYTDYNWRAAPSPDAEAIAIRTLARMGQIFPATHTLQRKASLSLTDARAQVEDIRRQS